MRPTESSLEGFGGGDLSVKSGAGAPHSILSVPGIELWQSLRSGRGEIKPPARRRRYRCASPRLS